MAKILIIDGNSLLFRAFYATYNPQNPDFVMKNQDGIPTNAIFAFSNMILSLISSLNKEDGFFVAFDKDKKTFRHKKFAEYKANRAPAPEALKPQFAISRELMDALNIRYYEDSNLEADDIAAIMAKKCEKDGYKVYLYTSDKDYLQLINDNTTVELIKKGLKDIHEMTPSSFKEEWGFDPKQIIEYKGLMGDPSDNLKGIPGVGDKTAKTLIMKYGDLDNIIEHANELTPSLKTKIIENQEMGQLCRELATMDTTDDVPFTSQDVVYQGYDFNKVSAFANKYNFKNMINKLPKKLRAESADNDKVEFTKISKLDEKIKPTKIGISVDFTNENYHIATLLGLALSIDGKNYYISEEDLKSDGYLQGILKNKSISKYAFDYKKVRFVLEHNGYKIDGLFFDLLIASYLIEPGISNDLNSILSYYSININYAYNNMDLFSEGNALLCACEAHYSLSLSNRLLDKLNELTQIKLYRDIEIPLVDVLADMEIEGFPLDKKTLEDFGDEYKKIIEAKKENIYRYAGKQFNINSTKELADILYNQLQLKDNKKHSTSIDYLIELSEDHPIINEIIEYRKYNKLLSTYINGFIPYIDEDGKIHATFNQAITSTGRLSSSEPNLQNISVRDEDGKQIRKAFFYKEDNLNILSLDYSQIELRILASLSDNKEMISMFNNDEDIHSSTAKLIFHLTEEPTSLERRKAKAVNFGIVYGISDWGLAEQINCSIPEARQIMTSFNKEFPQINIYLNSLVKTATEKGFAETMFNRRRYLPELNSDNYSVREFAKRAAKNAPIQGSAADLIKIAMIKVYKALKENNYEAKIVSQIHDELIIKVNDQEKVEVMALVKNIMEHCVKLKVKLKVDGGYAKTWFDAK